MRLVPQMAFLVALLPNLTAEDVLVEPDQEMAAQVTEQAEAEASQAQVMEDELQDPYAEIREQIEAISLQQQLEELQRQQATKEHRQRMAEQQLILEQRQMEMQLAESAQQAEFAEMNRQRTKLEMEMALAQQKAEFAMFEQRQELAKAQFDIEKQRFAQEQQQMAIDAQLATLAELQAEHQLAVTEWQLEQQRYETELALIATKQQRQDIASLDIAYSTEPVKDNVLTLSDRQIPLNGPIMFGSADYMVDRIAFFNNQDQEAPIFIIIDSCPGGSIMQGDRIVRAMEASEAPIYVVVTNFAASMAAVILAEADHSYVYPNAIIMHHQPWGGLIGNIAEQREWVEVFERWGERLHAKTAARMGITVKELYEQMYQESVTGDWSAFGDEAVELKWADATISDIIDQGIVQRPVDEDPWFIFMQAQQAGEQPNRQIILPQLDPFDGYFMYDPYKRYQVAQ